MIELYEWQKKAVKEFMDKKELVVASATATGKTQMALECIKTLREKDPSLNFLIVVPKIVLIETLWLPKLNSFGFGLNQVGVVYGFAHEFSKITITTIASVRNIDLDIFQVLICDEIHNMQSSSLLKILEHEFIYKLGLSASVISRDGKHWQLLKLFNYNIFTYTIKDALRDKIINRFNFTSIGVNITEPDVRKKYDELEEEIKSTMIIAGGFHKYQSLPSDNPYKLKLQKLFNARGELVMNYPRKIDVVVDIILKNKDKQILVFNQYNSSSTKIFWALVEKEVKSELVNSSMDKKIADSAVKSFNEGKLKVLLTTRQLDEGIDIKGADIAILCSSNSSMRQLIQRVGRVLRKKDVLSSVYNIFIPDTFEADYSLIKENYLKELCENFIEEEH